MSHNDSHSESYAKAGVDVTAGYDTVKKIKPMVESTYIPGVIGSIGGFGGMFAPDVTGMKQPVLVSGADGVGTKLRIAFALNKHDTVGIDCVAMCVNDIACSGAKPIFFLDYLAVGKLDPSVAADIVSGVAEGCRQAGCALVGGETAEMPGFYPVGEYDLAGFAVGIVDRDQMLEESLLKEGDVLIGVASSGMHSNGFSLARKVLGDDVESLSAPLGDSTVGHALLTPTKIYVKTLEAVRNVCEIKSVAHITGGGWYENIPRALPENITARLYKNALPVPAVFKTIMEKGNIPERDMYNTFNMGVGLVIGVAPEYKEKVLAAIEKAGEKAAVLGECVKGEKGIEIC
ncbi:MAG: phosphoribosylformylglycinamidine cyclo-ligase [Clostridiaceae bacterium]|nr:phosphoribosylformylglycinamidine cyclo-ligase [Clostridiaceae bacterium]